MARKILVVILPPITYSNKVMEEINFVAYNNVLTLDDKNTLTTYANYRLDGTLPIQFYEESNEDGVSLKERVDNLLVKKFDDLKNRIDLKRAEIDKNKDCMLCNTPKVSSK